jgi:hemerythrin-like metal-binding protein
MGNHHTKDIEIGIPVLDEQHHALTASIAQLEGLVAHHGRAEIDAALRGLAQVTKEHFDTEQRLMVAYDFPRHHEIAGGAHARLYEDVVKLQSEVSAGRRHLDAKALTSLRNWLTRHIAEDKQLAAYMKSAEAVVGVANQIVLRAHVIGASDIHIDSYAANAPTRVRFRKDGALFDFVEIPAAMRGALISRLKIMANLDISERRKPQDGRIDFAHGDGERIELRVATIPTASGLENVVMRLLATSRLIPLGELGLGDDMVAQLKELAVKPYGLFLVCGPTGSGKTTTLHSILSHINTTERKIWTAEDPIEITQPGLCQVQVNPKIGWTFAGAMRSLLRADPDVIMVGEMRDAETAKISIEASLTGHLVFSTLHTNSAPESVVRLLDLGMDRFNFSDALLGVLAQRLAKRLCGKCRQAYAARDEEIAGLLDEYCLGVPLEREAVRADWLAVYAKSGRFTLYRAAGCEECHNLGYAGRVALHELLIATATVRRLVQTGAPVEELRNAGIREGMRTLKQNGIEKVLRGDTDIYQIRAVCT